MRSEYLTQEQLAVIEAAGAFLRGLRRHHIDVKAWPLDLACRLESLQNAAMEAGAAGLVAEDSDD